MLQEFNDSIPDSAFVAHEVIGLDVLTAADIAILPYVERWLAIEEYLASKMTFLDLENVHGWYEKISSMPWAGGLRQPEHRFRNHYRMCI